MVNKEQGFLTRLLVPMIESGKETPVITGNTVSVHEVSQKQSDVLFSVTRLWGGLTDERINKLMRRKSISALIGTVRKDATPGPGNGQPYELPIIVIAPADVMPHILQPGKVELVDTWPESHIAVYADKIAGTRETYEFYVNQQHPEGISKGVTRNPEASLMSLARDVSPQQNYELTSRMGPPSGPPLCAVLLVGCRIEGTNAINVLN